MAASAEGHRISLREGRGDRPAVEHHRHRGLGRAEAPRRALSAGRQLQRARALGSKRGGATGESDRHERVERRHRQMADHILKEMVQRGAESWTSPDPALRCAIASVNVPPIQIAEIENWMWKNKRIRIRGGGPSKIRLSTPYYLLRKDVDRFLAAYDEYRREKKLA